MSVCDALNTNLGSHETDHYTNIEISHPPGASQQFLLSLSAPGHRSNDHLEIMWVKSASVYGRTDDDKTMGAS